MTASPLLVGCDFSSSPTPRKPIVVALGHAKTGRVQLQSLLRFNTLVSFADWLKLSQTWVGGFDLPFGLPRELVEHLQWPTDWLACMQHYSALSRADIRATFKTFCDARPVGGKFAHRATDTPAGSSPSMKWVNPPVAYMLHAGVPLLIEAGVTLPRLHAPVVLADYFLTETVTAKECLDVVTIAEQVLKWCDDIEQKTALAATLNPVAAPAPNPVAAPNAPPASRPILTRVR